MVGQIGYGQQAPNDANSDFNNVAFLVSQMMKRMDTMKLVQVTAVTGGGVAPAGTVDVLPLVMQRDGNNNVTAHGTVPGLPWSRVQGGKNAIVCDPQVGDLGWVVAADRDTSSVRANQKQSPPGSWRVFDIADGVYAGGCLNAAPDQYLIFTSTGVRLVDKNGNSVSLGTTGINMTDLNGNQVQMLAGRVNIVTASFEVNGVPVTVP